MDHKSKTVNPLGRAGRVHHPWRHILIGNDLQEIIIDNLVLFFAEGRQHHGLQHIEAHNFFKDLGSGINDHIHSSFLQKRHPIIISAGGNNCFPPQLFQGCMFQVPIEIIMGGYNHLGLLHGFSQKVNIPQTSGHKVGGKFFGGRPLQNFMNPAGVEFQVLYGFYEFADPVFQDGIGKGQILGKLAHHPGNFVVGQSGKKQNPGVVKIIAEYKLHMPQRPFMDHASKGAAHGHGGFDPLTQHAKLFRPPLKHMLGADGIWEFHTAQSDCIGLSIPFQEQLQYFIRIPICSQTSNGKIMAQEFSLKFIIGRFRAKADADDLFHVYPPLIGTIIIAHSIPSKSPGS